MSEQGWIHLFAAIPGTIASVATLLVALRGLKRTEEVHKATNSMKDALVAAEKKVSFTEGQADERSNRTHSP